MQNGCQWIVNCGSGLVGRFRKTKTGMKFLTTNFIVERIMKRMNLLFFIVLLSSAVFLPMTAQTKTYEECNVPAKAGLITASSLLTLPYFFIKMGYGVMGAFTAGTINFLSFRYAEPTAEKIAIKSAGGNWYITPQILLGEKKLEFSGSID